MFLMIFVNLNCFKNSRISLQENSPLIVVNVRNGPYFKLRLKQEAPQGKKRQKRTLITEQTEIRQHYTHVEPEGERERESVYLFCALGLSPLKRTKNQNTNNVIQLVCML